MTFQSMTVQLRQTNQQHLQSEGLLKREHRQGDDNRCQRLVSDVDEGRSDVRDFLDRVQPARGLLFLAWTPGNEECDLKGEPSIKSVIITR